MLYAVVLVSLVAFAQANPLESSGSKECQNIEEFKKIACSAQKSGVLPLKYFTDNICYESSFIETYDRTLKRFNSSLSVYFHQIPECRGATERAFNFFTKQSSMVNIHSAWFEQGRENCRFDEDLLFRILRDLFFKDKDINTCIGILQVIKKAAESTCQPHNADGTTVAPTSKDGIPKPPAVEDDDSDKKPGCFGKLWIWLSNPFHLNDPISDASGTTVAPVSDQKSTPKPFHSGDDDVEDKPGCFSNLGSCIADIFRSKASTSTPNSTPNDVNGTTVAPDSEQKSTPKPLTYDDDDCNEKPGCFTNICKCFTDVFKSKAPTRDTDATTVDPDSNQTSTLKPRYGNDDDIEDKPGCFGRFFAWLLSRSGPKAPTRDSKGTSVAPPRPPHRGGDDSDDKVTTVAPSHSEDDDSGVKETSGAPLRQDDEDCDGSPGCFGKFSPCNWLIKFFKRMTSLTKKPDPKTGEHHFIRYEKKQWVVTCIKTWEESNPEVVCQKMSENIYLQRGFIDGPESEEMSILQL